MEEKIRHVFTLKLSHTDIADSEAVAFCNAQSNFNDAIRYLIEKEISENGIRDLALFVPRRRGRVRVNKQHKPTAYVANITRELPSAAPASIPYNNRSASPVSEEIVSESEKVISKQTNEGNSVIPRGYED